MQFQFPQRSGLAAPYGIYSPVMGSWRLTSGQGRCWASWSPSSPPADRCLAHSRHRLQLKPSPQKVAPPGTPSCPEGPVQRDPTSSSATPRPWWPVSEPLSGTFPAFPFLCEQESASSSSRQRTGNPQYSKKKKKK